MSRLDAAEVRRIAALAGLDLDDGEVQRLAGELGDLLARLEGLRELPAPPLEEEEDDGVRLRPDAPPSEPLARPPETFAPAWRDGFFLVPRLEAMEDDGDVSR